MDEDVFFLRLLFPEERELDGGGRRRDAARPGLDVITSETGRFPLELRHVVVRQVCANGMTRTTVGRTRMSRRKTGVERVELTRALEAALNGAIASGRDMADRLADTRVQSVRDPVAEVGEIFRRYRLGSVNGRVGRWILAEASRNRSLFGVPRFDIVQAFTAVARDLEPAERMRIEDAMGEYVLAA